MSLEARFTPDSMPQMSRPASIENAEGNEFPPINMDDGMDPIDVPQKITRDNFHVLFGQAIPEGLSPDIFNEDGDTTLELAEG